MGCAQNVYILHPVHSRVNINVIFMFCFCSKSLSFLTIDSCFLLLYILSHFYMKISYSTYSNVSVFSVFIFFTYN